MKKEIEMAIDKVQLTRVMEVIPTTILGEHNPNALFETLAAGDSYAFTNPAKTEDELFNASFSCLPNPYPYPYAYMEADRQLEDVEYLKIIIENEFLRVEVLPHLGSRLHRILDKTNKRELIHRAEKVVSNYLFGSSGGTYVGVGAELSIPDHHSMTNSREREYRVIEHDDGSASIAVGELDLRYQLRWSIVFTLKPGDGRLYQKVTITNAGTVNGRFRYWSNLGVPVDGRDIEIFLPETEGWEHGGEFQKTTWPLWDGVDMSRHLNLPNTIGIEGADISNGFMAYYDHRNSYGMVHWADPGDVKGKKFWAWCKDQKQHSVRLSDGKSFFEFQSGRDEDQERFEIISPGTTVTWDEVWYGIDALETVNNASDSLAVGVKGGKIRLQSAIVQTVDIRHPQSDRVWDSVKLVPGQVLELEAENIDGGMLEIFSDSVLKLTVPLTKPEAVDGFIERMSNDWPIADESSVDSLMASLRKQMRFGPKAKSVLHLEMLERVLKLSPGHAEALKLKGMSLAERDLWEKARCVLKNSLRRNEFDPESHYFHALVLEKLGRPHEADLEYAYAAKYGYHQVAHHRRGMLALSRKDFSQAEEYFRNGILYNGYYAPTRTLYAWLLAESGRKAEALEILDEQEKLLPVEPLTYLMRYCIENGSFKGLADNNPIAEQLHADVQTYLALLEIIADTRDYTLVAEFCGELEKILDGVRGNGMLPYYTYYYRSLAGLAANYPVPVTESTRYTFPYRTSEFPIIEFALRQNSEDAIAHHYRGMLFGAKIRFSEAYDEFQIAWNKGLCTPELGNALGSIALKSFRQPEQAVIHYEQALELAPDNLFTLNYLADAYQELGNAEVRLERLFQHPAAVTNMDLVSKHLAFLKQFKSQHDALKLYERVQFPGMAQELSTGYFETLIQLGTENMKQRQYEEALKYFEKARIYPKNFGREQCPSKRRNIVADYFVGKAFILSGKQAEGEAIWLDAIAHSEQYSSWRMSGAWDYGLLLDRFYQGWMLRELGRISEANTYFDMLKAEAACKMPHQYSVSQRRDLMNLAYNGLYGDTIYLKDVDMSYLKKE